jgi:Mrp family chromosome partitioning ATPase
MTTNQAFIKAYRQDSAESAATRPTSAAPPRPMVAALGTSVQYVSIGAGPSAATNDTRVPLPSRQTQGAGFIDWPTCDAPFGRIDAPTSGKRPLSAFTVERRTAERKRSATPGTTAFQPATTVASFSWPSVCRTLCQQSGPEFDRVADLIIRQAEDARSLVGVIGLFPGRGATTSLLCVAARLAARGRRAIIVEGNFLSPRLAALLDAEPTAWWQDVLERGVPIADAVIRADDDNLDLLPLDRETSDPLRLAGSLQVSTTAGALRYAYDLVLVDLGPFFDPDSQPIALELVRNMRIRATWPRWPNTSDKAVASCWERLRIASRRRQRLNDE